MENPAATFSPGSLLCDEIFDAKGEADEFSANYGGENDEEHVKILLEREISNGVVQIRDVLENVNGGWIKKARLEAIQYILNKRDLFGFRCDTAYLSVTYLDRFLARRTIDRGKYWAVRLLAMACLSLAAKMEENVVPALPEFCVEDCIFESKVIQRMELLVLTTMEWKMGFITSFAFTHYFVQKFYQNPPSRDVFSLIGDLILGAMKDVNIMSHRASVIAAAATLVSLDQKLNKEALEQKLNLLFSNGVLKIDDVVFCYNQILELQKVKLNEGIVSPDTSPTPLQRAEVMGISSITSAAGSKRKRLTFNEEDQREYSPIKKQEK